MEEEGTSYIKQNLFHNRILLVFVFVFFSMVYCHNICFASKTKAKFHVYLSHIQLSKGY